MKKMKNYTDLSKLKTFEERFDYLKLDGQVGSETFGNERFLNQAFYSSREWKRARDIVITRDLGCDLGVEGFEIFEKPIIHHMNPITIEQIENRDPIIFDPEFLITVTHRTHNDLHYGIKTDDVRSNRFFSERKKNDTKLW